MKLRWRLPTKIEVLSHEYMIACNIKNMMHVGQTYYFWYLRNQLTPFKKVSIKSSY